MKSSPFAAQLRIHIVGAGMAGMGAALSLSRQGFTNIHIWESAFTLGEVGAGINITPNLSRILQGWGVLDIVRAESVALTGASVLNCATDTPLSSVDFSYIEREFGWPFIVVHRRALQKCLVEGAMRSGVVKLHTGKLVTEYDFEKTQLLVVDRKRPEANCLEDGIGNQNRGGSVSGDGHANGSGKGNGTENWNGNWNGGEGSQWVEADVILAADGVKSKARGKMLGRKGESDDVLDTGQAAYRIMVRREMINEDPELLPFFTGSHSYRWIGEKRHIIAYPIDSHNIFNMSTAHPDRRFVEADSWTAAGSKKEMLQVFHDFCPRVQKLLNLVPEGDVLEWKLRVHTPLSHWVDNNVALVGDACHPTLPHLAQGAAQAVEDAAVLGVVLGRIKSEADIHKALMVFQTLRKPRADWTVMEAAANGKGLHLGGGKDQEARDAAFKAANKAGGKNPDKAIDRDIQRILYAHDVEKEAEERFNDLFAEQL